MKTIGIIGGMSWHSTADYYRNINQAVSTRVGGLASAKIILISVNFSEMAALQRAGDWQNAGKLLAAAAVALQKAGAECVLLATNTMHLIADDISTAVSIPFLHIADALGNELQKQGVNQILLLGTGYTMRMDFYRRLFSDKYDVKMLTPNEEDIDLINGVIFDELCQGKCRKESKREFLRIIRECTEQGAQGVAFACTEIGMLLSPDEVSLPVFDTTALHCLAAVDFALGENINDFSE